MVVFSILSCFTASAIALYSYNTITNAGSTTHQLNFKPTKLYINPSNVIPHHVTTKMKAVGPIVISSSQGIKC